MVASSPVSLSAPSRPITRVLLAILLVLVPASVAGTLIAVPFSTPMGGFWNDAQQLARMGRIDSVFTPCGYPALLGIGFRSAGIGGVVALQLLIYSTIILAVYMVFRLLAIDRITAAASSALLALHPDVVISIKKIWDTDITALFLMLICASLLTVMRRGLTPARATMIGVLWGLSITVRPNFPALLLPIAFAFWFAAVPGHRLRNMLLHTTVVLLGATITVAIVNTAVHGAFFLPQNGPYNLYAGDNAFTEQALLHSLNAEPSIYPSLVANGFAADVNVYDPALRSYYVDHALLFIRERPLVAVKLVFVKLATLLRPDTKIYPLASLAGGVKGLVALAIPFWLIALVSLRNYRWAVEDWLFVMFAVAYIIPFLLTNADPRFRIPLDLLVLTHAMYRIARFAPAAMAQLRSQVPPNRFQP